MAKLSAHGTELLRVQVLSDVPDGEGVTRVTARETVYSYRSDGHIMRAQRVTFAPCSLFPRGERHDYGWKLYKRFKPEIRRNPALLRETVQRSRESWLEKVSQVSPGKQIIVSP